MNEFHKHLVAKFFPDANYSDLSLGEIEAFIEQINYVCQSQRNACARKFAEHYPTITARSKGTIGIIIKNAEITEADYE
jgi:hypothetical protein